MLPSQHSTSTRASARTFTPEALDYELARRQAYPPHLVPGLREEWTTVEALQAELASTPIEHEDYSWREWELALAERQAEFWPHRRFYRIVAVA
jgi:hypothetical protein